MSNLTASMKQQINNMSRVQMAQAHRFAPAGDPMFQEDAGRYFQKRFQELGGFSPTISKKIGW